MIGQDYLYELSQRTDIVELISSYVSLKRTGGVYRGLCPFHSERTPSFTVYPDTRSFYCFGCTAGGDAISFIKRIENLEYVEAVKRLAERAGMPLPDDADDEQARLKSRIRSMNAEAGRFFYEQLNSECGKAARGYLRARGFSDAVIRRFGLGYAPGGRGEPSLRDHLKSKGYSENEMEAAALVKRGERGSYDYFRSRVMVPIIDVGGKVVAFGGRVLDDSKPKYLNSPDTPVYKKGRNIYALNIAKSDRSDPARRLILAEGYMDVIALHQAGFTNSVAGLGTALTDEQVRLLANYCDEICVCYDSDEAGQKATTRAIEKLRGTTMRISVIQLDDAKDPDEYIKKFGSGSFAARMDGSRNAVEFELSKLRNGFDISTDDGRVRYVGEAARVLAGALTPAERETYCARVASETGLSKTAVTEQVKSLLKSRAKKKKKEGERELLESIGRRADAERGADVAKALSERAIVMMALKYPDYLAAHVELSASMFEKEHTRAAYMALREAIEAQEYNGTLSSLAGRADEETAAYMSALIAESDALKFTKGDFDMHCARLLGRVSATDVSQMDEQSIKELVEKMHKDERRS